MDYSKKKDPSTQLIMTAVLIIIVLTVVATGALIWKKSQKQGKKNNTLQERTQLNETTSIANIGPTTFVIESSIERIHPKAELHQSQNVFLADALLVNESQLLRSGMQGSGSVACEKHALGWNLFHKAYYKLLWWLGW